MSRPAAPAADRGATRAAIASWVAVAVGAAMGTSARFGLDLLLPHALDAVPWSTILANTLGAFALGLLTAATWSIAAPWVRAGLGAGVLGSFTTFSSIMIAVVATTQGGPLAHGPGSVEPGSLAQAVGVLIGSVFAGLLAALVGILLGRRIARARLIPRAPVREEDEA